MLVHFIMQYSSIYIKNNSKYLSTKGSNFPSSSDNPTSTSRVPTWQKIQLHLY